MGNCQICGASSGMFPICKACNALKKKGEVKKCDTCGRWMKSTKPLCYECWCRSVGKTPDEQEKPALEMSRDPKGGVAKAEGHEKKEHKAVHAAHDVPAKDIHDRDVEVYKKVLIQAWVDGVLTDEEDDLLRALRESLGISEETHERLQLDVKNANRPLIESVKKLERTKNKLENDFRKKYPPKLRTKDGHVVRSKGERDIDNWLYEKEILHIYEKNEINTNRREVYCDFYLPYDKNGNYIGHQKGGIYVEFWGMTEREDYVKRMKQKMEFYDEKGLVRVDIYEEEMEDPETYLPKIFLKYFGNKVI